HVIQGLSLQDERGEEELSRHLELPLFPERCRDDKEDAPTTFGPLLREDKRSLNCLAQADLVGEQHATCVGRAQSEKRGLDLVRIEIDARVTERMRERLDTIVRVSKEKVVRPVGRVNRRRHTAWSSFIRAQWARSGMKPPPVAALRRGEAAERGAVRPA